MALLGSKTLLWQPSAGGKSSQSAVRAMVEEIEQHAASSEKVRPGSNGRSSGVFSGPYAEVLVVVEGAGAGVDRDDNGNGDGSEASGELGGCEVRFYTPTQGSDRRRVSDPSLPFSSSSLRSLRCKEMVVEVAVGRTVGGEGEKGVCVGGGGEIWTILPYCDCGERRGQERRAEKEENRSLLRVSHPAQC